MANLWQPSVNRMTDSNGDPVSGALLHFFLVGTSTRAPIYTSRSGYVALPNPVPADGNGKFPPVYMDPATDYRIRCTDPEGRTLYEIESVLGFDESQLSTASGVAVAAAQEAEGFRDEAEEFAGDAEEAAASAVTQRGLAEAASLAAEVYPNAYASSVPKGVTLIAITAPGSGYTNGTYALGVSGGPTGFAGTYTVTGNAVTSLAITNPGLSSSGTAPTLSFPSGGGTGATATATVNTLVANQSYYWAASSDSKYILRFQNVSGTATAVNNPDGTQIAQPNRNAWLEQISEWSLWQDTSSLASFPSLERILPGTWFSGLDNDETYYVRQHFRDNASGARFQFLLTRDSDDVDVLGVAASGSVIVPTGYTGVRSIPLVALNASGASGVLLNDFTDGSLFDASYAYAYTSAQTAVRNERTMFNDAQTGEIDGRAAAAAAAATSFTEGLFLSSATDTVAKRVFTGGKAISKAGERLFLNYQWDYVGGGPDLYRFAAIAHSADRSGAAVAQWSISNVGSPPTIPPKIYLSGMSDGTHLTPPNFFNDDGDEMLLHVDSSEIPAWNRARTAYTDMSATGLKPLAVVTGAAVQSRWLDHRIEASTDITVGPTGCNYTSIVAACAGVRDMVTGAQKARTTHPSSNQAFPASPGKIRVVADAYTEEVEPFQYLGVWQSPLALPHGWVLEVKPDTLIFMDDVHGAPVIEMNFTNRILLNGGVIEQRGASGYGVHIDNANALSRDSISTPETMIRWITSVIEDGTIRCTNAANTSALVASGKSDQQVIKIRGLHLEGGASTAQLVLVHDSPDQKYPGSLIISDCTSNEDEVTPANGFLLLQKLYSHNVRHSVYIERSELAKITVQNTGGGGPGFVRRFPASGITIDGDMEP